MTEEEANSSPGGSGRTYPDGHEVVPDDVVSMAVGPPSGSLRRTGHRSERTLHPAQTPLSVTKWRGRSYQRRSSGDPRPRCETRENKLYFRPTGMIRATRRVAPLGALTLLLGSALSVVAFAMPSADAATPVTLFSSSTPGYSSSGITVPANICFVSITASGGGGGVSINEAGGTGATVAASVAVTPGDALSVLVGGVGGAPSGPAGGPGGVGGGGGGSVTSGGGGGASVVTTAAGTPLVVAGGGGGGGAGGAVGKAGTLGDRGGSGYESAGGSPSGAGGSASIGGGGGGVTTGGTGPNGDNGGGGDVTGTIGGGGGATGGPGTSGATGTGQGGPGGVNEGSAGSTGGNGGTGTGSGGDGANANTGPLTVPYEGTTNGGGGAGGIGFGGGGGGVGAGSGDGGGGGGAGYGGGGQGAGGSSVCDPLGHPGHFVVGQCWERLGEHHL